MDVPRLYKFVLLSALFTNFIFGLREDFPAELRAALAERNHPQPCNKMCYTCSSEVNEWCTTATISKGDTETYAFHDDDRISTSLVDRNALANNRSVALKNMFLSLYDYGLLSCCAADETLCYVQRQKVVEKWGGLKRTVRHARGCSIPHSRGDDYCLTWSSADLKGSIQSQACVCKTTGCNSTNSLRINWLVLILSACYVSCHYGK